MFDPRWSSSSAQCGAAARDVTKGSRRRQESEWWSWAWKSWSFKANINKIPNFCIPNWSNTLRFCTFPRLNSLGVHHSVPVLQLQGSKSPSDWHKFSPSFEGAPPTEGVVRCLGSPAASPNLPHVVASRTKIQPFWLPVIRYLNLADPDTETLMLASVVI